MSYEQTKYGSKILVTVANQYGTQVCVPACPMAKKLAKLAGTKTLTVDALHTIEDLGFRIFYQPTALKAFEPREVSVTDLMEVLR